MRSTALAIVLLATAAAAPTAHAGSPELDYMLHCQGCHRADGGETPGSVPPLIGLVARFLEVPGGREYLVRVPGSSQSPLDDAELAALLNWIVRRFGPAESAEAARPYSADEVAAMWRPPLTDVDAVREALLARMETAERSTPGSGASEPKPE